MNVRVLTEDGVMMVDAATLTWEEHEALIDHWEQVFRFAVEQGVKDEDWLEERLGTIERARLRLYLGEVPFLGERPPRLVGPS
jgi:hypothetical protein